MVFNTFRCLYYTLELNVGFFSVNVYDVIHHYVRAFQLRYECHTLDMCPVFFGSTGNTMKHRKVDK
jgi:glutaminase